MDTESSFLHIINSLLGHSSKFAQLEKVKCGQFLTETSVGSLSQQLFSPLAWAPSSCFSTSPGVFS